jgi:hypothetical protein
MRLSLFTDPRYHAEATIDLDPSQVVAAEEKTVKLFLAGRHRVTQVTLRDGSVLLLRGAWKERLEAAQHNQPNLQ